MKRLVLLAAALAAAGLVQAQTLRWASAGDAQTLDPVSQNELFTNAMNGQYYEFLVARDKNLGIVPQLATEWKQDGPLKWTFKLRRGVKFHDGRPFTADDVVFSIKRATEKTSQIRPYAAALGEPKKIDDYTVEFNLQQVNPIFLQHLNTVYIMSKSWCEEHKATKPQDFTNKEEMFTARNANGTGPYMVVTREPDVKTVLKRNPTYWGKIDGNVQEVIYTPIKNDATRVAALVSGEVDFILDPPPRDLERLRNTPSVKVVDGPENRIVFIGMDQGRDELLYSSVKGKNPFKDVRVRKALYQAIDIETIKTKLMNGQAQPTGAVVPSSLGDFGDPEIEKRLPYDLEAAKKLMAEAGYGDGFEVTLDCPNNRYINDERICQTLASMWARLKVTVRVNAMPKVNYFPKLEKLDTSMYMLGWGGSITDAETTFTPVY
ncbi:MAG TPA: ABC transporter substrate-binding protein, partial [Burkholderiaceae bacterium]